MDHAEDSVSKYAHTGENTGTTQVVVTVVLYAPNPQVTNVSGELEPQETCSVYSTVDAFTMVTFCTGFEDVEEEEPPNKLGGGLGRPFSTVVNGTNSTTEVVDTSDTGRCCPACAPPVVTSTADSVGGAVPLLGSQSPVTGSSIAEGQYTATERGCDMDNPKLGALEFELEGSPSGIENTTAAVEFALVEFAFTPPLVVSEMVVTRVSMPLSEL